MSYLLANYDLEVIDCPVHTVITYVYDI